MNDDTVMQSRVQHFAREYQQAHAAWEKAFANKLAGTISTQQYYRAWEHRRAARLAWTRAKAAR